MKAMLLEKLCNIRENPTPLAFVDLPIPFPDKHEVLIKVSSCGVSCAEIDEIEGRAPPAQLPVIPGHQVVGTVVAVGDLVCDIKIGDRVGVAWIFSACGKCQFCLTGFENLCPAFTATGRDANGGYAEFMTVAESFAFKIPSIFSSLYTVPLLCAGTKGYRSLQLAGVANGLPLGLTGFGVCGHLVLKMARYLYPATDIFVFSRNSNARALALSLGAIWAGDTFDQAPVKLHRIIDTTPAWAPVVEALANLESGGRLIINAIRKENDLQSLLKLIYPMHLWQEKEVKTVANITRGDVQHFLQLAAQINIRPEVKVFALDQANQALSELKNGNIKGVKILEIN